MDAYRFFKRGACFSIVLMLGGCGGKSPPPIVPATGTVLLENEPLPNAQVRFIPQIDFGAKYIATAVTDEQGKFALQCNGQAGACEGENIIIVTEADIPPELQSENAQRELAAYFQALKNRPIPRNYTTPVNSPLRVTVTEGQAEYNLQLKR